MAPLELTAPVFYLLCAVVGLFCLVALGFGPAVFVLLGVSLAVIGFRARFRRWWGLPLAAGGLGLVMSVALGWGWQSVVGTVAVAFVVVLAARVGTRLVATVRR
jgi:hypothetical protein